MTKIKCEMGFWIVVWVCTKTEWCDVVTMARFQNYHWPFPSVQAQVVPLKPLRGMDSLTSGLFVPSKQNTIYDYFMVEKLNLYGGK